MSALGQKRTSETLAHNVRFTPESGHVVHKSFERVNEVRGEMSASKNLDVGFCVRII